MTAAGIRQFRGSILYSVSNVSSRFKQPITEIQEFRNESSDAGKSLVPTIFDFHAETGKTSVTSAKSQMKFTIANAVFFILNLTTRWD